VLLPFGGRNDIQSLGGVVEIVAFEWCVDHSHNPLTRVVLPNQPSYVLWIDFPCTIGQPIYLLKAQNEISLKLVHNCNRL